MRFFLDTNIPYSVLQVFNEFKLEAIHARNISLDNVTDNEIFEYVVKNKYVLVTKDLEFTNPKIFPIKLLKGLIILRLPFFFKADKQIKVLKEFLTSISIEDVTGCIAIIKLGSYRIRKI